MKLPKNMLTGNILAVSEWPEEPTTDVITAVELANDRFSNNRGDLVAFLTLKTLGRKIRLNKTNLTRWIEDEGVSDETNDWIGLTIRYYRVPSANRGLSDWNGIVTTKGGTSTGTARKGKGKSGEKVPS